MRRNASRALLVAIVLLGAAGCGSPGTVSLMAELSNPVLEVEELALGPRLKGSFELRLELGPEAPNNAEVTTESFAIVREAATLIAPLQALPRDATFPLPVGKGERKVVHFTLDDSKFIATEERDAVCAGSVRIAGAIRDAGSGGKLTALTTGDVVAACP